MNKRVKDQADKLGLSYEAMLEFSVSHPYARTKMLESMTKSFMALMLVAKKELNKADVKT